MTRELFFIGKPEVREQKTPGGRFCGCFFIIAKVFDAEGDTMDVYLHRDGRWGVRTARDENLLDFTGYYATRKAAEEALGRYGPKNELEFAVC